MKYTLTVEATQQRTPFQANDAKTGHITAGDPGDYLCTAPDGSQYVESKAWFEGNYIGEPEATKPPAPPEPTPVKPKGGKSK